MELLRSVCAESWLLLLLSSSAGLWCLYKLWMVVKNKVVAVAVADEKMAENGGCKVPRGSCGWPLIGETLEFIASGFTSNPLSFMEKRRSLYGDVFRTHILGKAIIVSTDPEVNKAILHNHGNIFIPSYPKTITELLGKSSILQINGSLHKRVHAVIGTFLKSTQFKARITRDIEKTIKMSLSTWSTHKNNRIRVQDETKKMTFEILVGVLMSMGPGEELELLKEAFGQFIKGLICMPIKFPGTTLYKSLKAKKEVVKMVKKMVEERKSAMVERSEKWAAPPRDAIDVLLSSLSSIEVSEEEVEQLEFVSGSIVEMMIPGEETVPTAMTLAVKFLDGSPAAVAHLMEENMELKKRKEDSFEEYCWTDYLSLPFTQNVINETLRLANIINAVWRKALNDVEIKGYLIPKGWCVLASLSSVHMKEKNYINPYEFDPWRWKGMGTTSNIFTPFGGGQRLCPGLELTRLEISIFLHHLVTTYEWVAEDDEIIYFPTVKMKKGLPITIKSLQPINCTSYG